MAWCFHGFVITLSFVCFCTSHIGFVMNMMTKCVYFQLWKSYDMFWLWLLLLITACIPSLRFDNNILLFFQLWWKVCGKADQRIPWVLKDQDDDVDEAELKLKKIVNAMNFGVDVIRLRISAAILVGNLRLRTANYRITPHSVLLFLDWDPYKITLIIDIAILWFMFFFNWWRQFYVCCQLGCCKFYLLLVGILVVGALIMEAPMWYLFHRMDKTWCTLNFDAVPVFNKSHYAYLDD